jgi:hypothetical protein
LIDDRVKKPLIIELHAYGFLATQLLASRASSTTYRITDLFQEFFCIT